ncbi:MAG TPA: ABC transporter substrate-binding protein [Candidatus Tectomicrobia bacterium]|nr:ABC transporter substrate-binding protein [Candidatus Tectomicrobia bacterium]
MDRREKARAFELSRRDFLVTTGGALAGMAAFGLVDAATAGERHPKRGGVLQYSSRSEIAGLDSHRHIQNHTYAVTAALYSGLTDIDPQGNIVPGIAESWEPNKELTTWTFRLRKGVLFHNGREVDAEAVKLNILRIKDPAIGHDFTRGSVEPIDSLDVLDRYTLRIHTTVPDASLPVSVMHYPTNLIAPDAFETVSEHPIGTGPFKFVSWKRLSETRLVRFENYWETDADGHNLPYLDEIVGKPKREDSVRLTALRTGQVQLIDAMSNADVERFKQSYSDKYNTWTWHYGGIFMVFNFRRGPFQDKRLRTAAAHAIDRNAIHHAVYYGQGAMSDQPYLPGNPWHLEGIRSLEYDPDKAKAILKEARAVGTAVKILCGANQATRCQASQVIQDLWTTVGFKVTVEPLDSVPFVQARKEGAFDGLINGHTYRYDPDAFFARNLHSQSEYAQILSGWKNERYDQLIEEGKRTRDPARRKELYTEAWNIVNVELPHFYLHEEPFTAAAVKGLRDYQHSKLGALSYQGGSFRTAYIEA